MTPIGLPVSQDRETSLHPSPGHLPLTCAVAADGSQRPPDEREAASKEGDGREGFPVRRGGDVDLSKVCCAQDCCRDDMCLAVDDGSSSVGGKDGEGVEAPDPIVDLGIGGGEGRGLKAVNRAGVWHSPVRALRV